MMLKTKLLLLISKILKIHFQLATCPLFSSVATATTPHRAPSSPHVVHG